MSETNSKPSADHAATPGGRKPIARFVIAFGFLVGLFYLGTGTAFFKESMAPRYLSANARISSGILIALGQETQADGKMIHSKKFAMEVERGCDAVEPTALFLAAVLASPVALKARLMGMVAGAMALAFINVLRLVSLFLTGIYWHAAFEVMHVDVWQAIFIFLAILFWVLWALWALGKKPTRTHVSA